MITATVSDVAARLGRPISDPDEVTQVTAWLSDAETLIVSRIPDIEARIVAGNPSPQVVVMGQANAVVRKVRNPDGKQNERIDDYSYGYSAEAARGELYLTADEGALLDGAVSSGAWTIHPASQTRAAGTWVHPDVWVPLP